ncbi:MAG: hypothetical protein V3U60_11130 [Gammaproteobacteria bacterium]
MAVNCVVPSQQRKVEKDGTFGGFYKPPRYRETEYFPELIARGVLPFQFLPEGDRFLGCAEPPHVLDVLSSEGHFPRPVEPEWRKSYDRRTKAARERVRKRRLRAGEAVAGEES